MICLDINTFFSPKAGGIRTYHRAKIEWFKARPQHAYHLVYPGPAQREVREAANVVLEEAFGPAVTKDPAGYRLMLDYVRAYKLIRAARPDVLEAGDPWLTGLFCILLKKLGLFRGLLVSFYHGDPVPSYFEPWAAKGRLRPLRKALTWAGAALFYRLQRMYDLTAVSSKVMEARLRSKGVRAVAHLPFGAPAFFLRGDPSQPRKSGPGGGDVRLLYAGRLDREKGVDLLLEALPGLLKASNVRVTVAGRGAYANRFSAFKHPRCRYLGFVDGPEQMRDLYDSHHILLAPGPYETFGLGVLEAMARGLVVVGPDQGGTGELLRQAQSPFLFAAGDGFDFLRAIDKALECDWDAEIGRSLELAGRYGSWDDAIGRMLKRYASVLGGSI